jgi:hypothetical protein
MSSKDDHLDHVKIRMWERFGKYFSGEKVDRITADIKEKRAKLLTRLSFTISVWEVAIDDLNIIVIYDSNMECPITVLTESLWKEREFKVCNSKEVLRAPNPKIINELSKLKGDNNAG